MEGLKKGILDKLNEKELGKELGKDKLKKILTGKGKGKDSMSGPGEEDPNPNEDKNQGPNTKLKGVVSENIQIAFSKLLKSKDRSNYGRSSMVPKLHIREKQKLPKIPRGISDPKDMTEIRDPETLIGKGCNLKKGPRRNDLREKRSIEFMDDSHFDFEANLKALPGSFEMIPEPINLEIALQGLFSVALILRLILGGNVKAKPYLEEICEDYHGNYDDCELNLIQGIETFHDCQMIPLPARNYCQIIQENKNNSKISEFCQKFNNEPKAEFCEQIIDVGLAKLNHDESKRIKRGVAPGSLCAPVDVDEIMAKDFLQKHAPNSKRYNSMSAKLTSGSFGPDGFEDLLMARWQPNLFDDNFNRVPIVSKFKGRTLKGVDDTEEDLLFGNTMVDQSKVAKLIRSADPDNTPIDANAPDDLDEDFYMIESTDDMDFCMIQKPTGKKISQFEKRVATAKGIAKYSVTTEDIKYLWTVKVCKGTIRVSATKDENGKFKAVHLNNPVIKTEIKTILPIDSAARVKAGQSPKLPADGA